MPINIHIEYKLVSKTVINQEYCFVVDSEWFEHMYNRHFKKLFNDEPLEEFLNSYNPNYEGAVIYLVAKQHNEIINEGWVSTK